MEKIEQSPYYRATYHSQRAKYFARIGDSALHSFHLDLARAANREIDGLEKMERINEMYKPLNN